MTSLKVDNISRGWIALAASLIILEFVFLYEATVGDMGGYERIFAAFAGLAILCFAALLYAASVVFYGWK
jgi:hypothetical protein